MVLCDAIFAGGGAPIIAWSYDGGASKKRWYAVLKKRINK